MGVVDPINEKEEISFKEIKKKTRAIPTTSEINSQEIVQNFEAEFNAQKLQIELEGQAQFFNLQKSWANHIRWQIWTVLVFQFVFVFFIGFNVGNFTDNILKLPYMYVLVILQSLANIIALGFVVAKFLFPQRSHK